MSARGRLLLFIVGLIPSVWLLRAVGSDAQSLWQVEYGRTPGVRKRIPYVEWPERGDDRLSQRRRYFYTRRLSRKLSGSFDDSNTPASPSALGMKTGLKATHASS